MLLVYKTTKVGRAIAPAVSRWLPNAAARVWSCGICDGQSGAGAGFLRVLRFPLPIFIPPTAPQSPSSIFWGLYNRPEVAAVPRDLVPPHKKKQRFVVHSLQHIKMWSVLLLTHGNTAPYARAHTSMPRVTGCTPRQGYCPGVTDTWSRSSYTKTAISEVQ
jgi:hypothetical protein